MQSVFSNFVFPNLPRLRPGPGLKAIVSGGQTGVDQGALDAALEAGFPCAGWCPADRMSEAGPIPPQYPLLPVEFGGYRTRTRRNLEASDGTLIFFQHERLGGTLLTATLCQQMRRPHLFIDAGRLSVIQAADKAAAFIDQTRVEILNVAGPRASKWPSAHDYCRDVLSRLIKKSIANAARL